MKELKIENPNIIIADDDDDDLIFLVSAFKMVWPQANLIQLKNGQEVVDYVSSTGQFKHRPKVTPHILILDINMPMKDGCEAGHEIRNMSGNEHLLIVIFSGAPPDTAQHRALNCGADEFLTKPIRFEEYRYRVERIRDLWRGRMSRTY